MSKYMIANEARLTGRQVCQYLRICRKTLYRLVKRKRLIGYKTPRGWRFKWAEVIAYVRIKYPGRVFPGAMLIKYHQAPHKYRVTKEKRGLVGRLSPRPEYLKRLSPEKRAREYFKPIKYHRVRLEGNLLIIVVSHRHFDRLPKAEKTWWLRFEMSRQRPPCRPDRP